MSGAGLPSVTRVYQNHHLDSTRWEHFKAREGDVVIATSVKSGTTWMQWITLNLIFPDGPPTTPGKMSPWLEMAVPPLDMIMGALEGMEHRRVIKCHLPLDGLKFFPEAKYIVIGRDGRDVAMSLWNFYSDFSDMMYEKLAKGPYGPLPRCPETFQEFWSDWVSKGFFDWESDGYPFWSHLRFAQTWWNYRHLDNILFIHFEDMLKDLEGSVQRIADHLSIDVSAEQVRHVAEISTFDHMKKNIDKTYPLPFDGIQKSGRAAFFDKGTNGRWREVLTEENLRQYQEAVDRTLSPDCAKWLEHGGKVS